MSGGKPIRLGAVATAVPPCRMDQIQVKNFLMGNYLPVLTRRSEAMLRKIFSHPSVQTRHFAFDKAEDIVGEDPDLRAARFNRWSAELSVKAAREALAATELKPADLSAVVVNTCTGYLCPGISSYVMETMGMPNSIRAYDLVGAGCGGALPNLHLGRDIAAGSGGPVLSIAVEICSATFQMDNDASLLVSNAIFGDGAAACILWDKPRGLILQDMVSLHAPQHREAVRYVYRNGQLHNQLAPDLPEILGRSVTDLVHELLDRNGLAVSNIRFWAIHPGGERVITAIGEALGLSDEQTAEARRVLAVYGNMSSPSLLFEMQQFIRNGIAPGEWCVMIGAGAGLSVYAYLLQG